ncbi:MAG: hypothetical protein KAY32_13190 [Candidatus Eisenbacteria sp.]|nr:hypothetical protein [Candidatus Eisenbacteria bacterium]
MGRICISLLLVALILALCVPTPTRAQVAIESARSGWWHNPNTWSPALVPTLMDDVLIHPDHSIHVQWPAVARSIVNNGIIDHPDGTITSDRRVRILLMIGVLDHLENNGQILGFNAPGTERSEGPCPTAVMLTLLGDSGQLLNNGLIRGGDGYTAGWGSSRIIELGGGVIIRGQPLSWNPAWPAPGFGPCADLHVFNNGIIEGGSAALGGFIVIGWSPVGGPDWPFLPFASIVNRGLIQSGVGSGLPAAADDPWASGSICLFSSDFFDATILPPPDSDIYVRGGNIDGDGGQMLIGADPMPGFGFYAVSDEITLSGPGTEVSNACGDFLVGWWNDPGNWWGYPADWVSLRDLDADALFAPRPNPFMDVAGGMIYSWAFSVDMQDNPSDQVVLRAEEGTMFPASITIRSPVLMLDPGVAIEDITEPDAVWTPARRLSAGAPQSLAASLERDGEYEPMITLLPISVPEDTSPARFPGPGLASPGDTASVQFLIMANQELPGQIHISATDSLGYYIPNNFQTIPAGFFPLFATVEFDIVIPQYAAFGTKDRLDVSAVCSADPSVTSDLSIYLNVVPTVDVTPPFSWDTGDTLFTPGTTIPYSFSVRNEGRNPLHLHLTVYDSQGWEFHTEYGDLWMSPGSDTTYPVHLTIPIGASVGEIDTLYVCAEEVYRSHNYDLTHVIVEVGEEVSAVEAAREPSWRALSQNRPNPFNPRTEIRLALTVADRVTLGIYDLRGRLVRSLLRDHLLAAGEHRVLWDGTDQRGNELPSGTYFYRLRAGGLATTRKVVLVE